MGYNHKNGTEGTTLLGQFNPQATLWLALMYTQYYGHAYFL